MKEEMLIKLYLKYLNKPEDYMNDYRKPFSELQSEIEKILTKLSLNSLIDLYCKYSGIIYLRENLDVDSFFEVLLRNILIKFDNLSPIEMIDLYAKVNYETALADSSLKSNETVIANRLSMLSKDYFVNQIHDLKNYKETLEMYRSDMKYYQKSFNILNNLKNNISERLNFNIENLPTTEKEEVLIALNIKFETNHQEIDKRKYARNQKNLELARRFKDITLYEQQNALDTTVLENDNKLYTDFISSLTESLGKNLK